MVGVSVLLSDYEYVVVASEEESCCSQYTNNWNYIFSALENLFLVVAPLVTHLLVLLCVLTLKSYSELIKAPLVCEYVYLEDALFKAQDALCLLLSSFKEQLQQHVRVHAMEAVMACWELEQSLQSLTGVAPGEGTGATMSDDDEDQADSEMNLFDESLDGPDSMGFGPLVPTESERSLMERVRQELKHELKQGYKEKIVDIREEILRKRRAGKLPGDTTSVLKAWWQSHSKWPYPTEEDKARLVQETGLQLKQINNWFINQRKRNWHSNPSSSTSQKSKRKK
ncbi:Homeobox protein knotted-1-like LET12 [Sesamum angolense]|uniref:Homeobox protein knotted-1-like LET12 n=1 Tax=Sesamum angolense TaxID=2727404 RepID=A0AAE1T3W1_9LAMI|nr:Homeobox protein knotted-1-like LET12 [Sesamum angolense]